jgi:hypothetical protein
MARRRARGEIPPATSHGRSETGRAVALGRGAGRAAAARRASTLESSPRGALKNVAKLSRRSLLLGSGLVAVPTLALLATPRRDQALNLFAIERSKNRNVVRYDLRLDQRGFYDARRPLDVYWSMLAEDGRREELLPLEWRAYGYELLPNAKPTELGVRLLALKSRPLLIRGGNHVYRAELSIRGVPGYLESVFVATRERSLLPTVLYIELRGRSLRDGRPLTERVQP